MAALTFFFFLPHRAPCGTWDLSSPTKIEPRPSAVRARSPNPWTAKGFPALTLLRMICGKKEKCILSSCRSRCKQSHELGHLSLFVLQFSTFYPCLCRIFHAISAFLLSGPFLPWGQEPGSIQLPGHPGTFQPWDLGSHPCAPSVLSLALPSIAPALAASVHTSPNFIQQHCTFLPEDFLWQPESTSCGQAGSAGELTRTRNNPQPTPRRALCSQVVCIFHWLLDFSAAGLGLSCNCPQ